MDGWIRCLGGFEWLCGVGEVLDWFRWTDEWLDQVIWVYMQADR